RDQVQDEHQVLHLRTHVPPIDEPLIQGACECHVRSVVGRRTKPTTYEDARQLWMGHVVTDGSDDVGVDIPDGCHQAHRVSDVKETAREPVGVRVDGKAAKNLVADDDDARLRHAPHNDRECPDPPTNAARASKLSPGASFLSAKASRSPSSMRRRRQGASCRASTYSPCWMRPPDFRPASALC